ncbi:MAG: hypothetical protein M3380_18205 [Chloroflexota bacterium]|nr:hypothetical protein [Chloroflexota bacterium]
MISIAQLLDASGWQDADSRRNCCACFPARAGYHKAVCQNSIQVNLIYRFGTPRRTDLDASRRGRTIPDFHPALCATRMFILFGNDGVMGRQLAYRMIDAAAHDTFFYRIVISPDPRREDTQHDIHLWELTDQTMMHLAERLQQDILYVAAEHNEHTPHRHAHALALVPQRLQKADLAALRSAATAAAVLQRTARDAVLAHHRREQEEDHEWER